MEELQYDDLLDCLKTSKMATEMFFCNSDEEEQTITVPSKYVLTNLNMTTDEQFNEIMDKLRYWMVDELPREVCYYVHMNNPDVSRFKDFFFEELQILSYKTSEYKYRPAIPHHVRKTLLVGNVQVLKYFVSVYKLKSFVFQMLILCLENDQVECLQFIDDNFDIKKEYNFDTMHSTEIRKLIQLSEYAAKKKCNQMFRIYD